MVLVNLPYFAPKEKLPADLPSIIEIDSSKDVLGGTKVHQRVVRIAPYFVVKYGCSVSKKDEP